MPSANRLAVIATLACALTAAADDDVVLADFEGADYGAWKAEGDAFGAGPARGTLANQRPVSGYVGKGLVNTYLGGDRATGTLTSPPFELRRRYVNFLIGGGAHFDQTCVHLLIDGKPVRSATGNDDEALAWATWDVADLAGRRATFQIVDRATGGWGHVNVDQVTLSDTPSADPTKPLAIRTEPLYDETYRPQFHFTARQNWLNDPNGLVFFDGAYHLFFQHNPKGNEWGNMTWGHATSPDLLRWTQREHALLPDATGTMFSGSAVVDRDDTAGFGKNAIVLIYTAAGGTNAESKGRPFTQCVAYSTDGGKTFAKYDKNPVLPNVNSDNRDPKVFWHAPTKRWVMALWARAEVNTKANGRVAADAIQFFASPDLKKWTHLDSNVGGFFECPDVFPLTVDGDPGKEKWVLFGADGEYVLGQFDGAKFVEDTRGFTRKLKGDHGSNFYAAQTFNDVPAADGRRILIGWMRGGRYPRMPFNQQMSFPAELTLRTTPAGVRLFKWPAREIATLYAAGIDRSDAALKPGENALAGVTGDCLDIEAEIAPGAATALTFDLRGAKIRWTRDQKLTVVGKTVGLPVDGSNNLRLRVLLDRASVETYVAGGLMTFSDCVTPRPENLAVSLTAEGGEAKLVSFKVRPIKSAWR